MPYRRHKNIVEFGGDVSQGFKDHESPSDPFDIVSTKSASVQRLSRWRQAALVLNASRRFRYTLDLKKEEEKKQILAKIRTHAQVIRAAYLFLAAGAQPNGTGSSSCLYTDHQKIEMTSDKIILEPPTVPSSGESRYLTHLWVSRHVEPRGELRQYDPSQSIATGKRSEKYIEFSKQPIRKRKRTDRSSSLEVSSKCYGKTMEEAADSLHGTGPSFRLYTDQNIKMTSDKIFLEHPAVPSSANVPNQWPSTNVSMESICDNFTFNMVNVTFNGSVERFMFPHFAGLLTLVNKVAKRFKQEGQGLRLKYIDEDNDLIVICLDKDLQLALDTVGSNSSINLLYGKTSF